MVPDIVTLREDIIQDKESWYNAADITDALLSITLHVDERISLMLCSRGYSAPPRSSHETP